MAWTAPTTRTTDTLITAAIWNTDIEDNLTFLGASHDHNGGSGDGGLAAFLPTGAIGIFDAACPSGWTRVSAWDGKFVRGAASYGGTGGADTHTHTLNTLGAHTHTLGAHTHTPASNTDAGAFWGHIVTGSGVQWAIDYHEHTISGSTASASESGTTGSGSPSVATASTLPAYIEVVFCKKN